MFSDLVKLYNHPLLDLDIGPKELLNKVRFDIRFYLCRRSAENFIEMNKNTFKLHFDEEINIAYVQKVCDEMTKNHKSKDNEITTGFMPQVFDENGRPHKLCPVRSYKNYISHLNPKCDKLWQQPLKCIPRTGDAWYKAKALGHSPIEKYHGRLFTECQISQYYTNQCIRVTGITNFKHSHCSVRQIMSVSGHKSISSLALYQHVRDDEKLMMGMKLTFNLLRPEEASRIKKIIKEQEERERLVLLQPVDDDAPPKKILKAIENTAASTKDQQLAPTQIVTVSNKQNEEILPIQSHARDPADNNILPLESK